MGTRCKFLPKRGFRGEGVGWGRTDGLSPSAGGCLNPNARQRSSAGLDIRPFFEFAGNVKVTTLPGGVFTYPEMMRQLTARALAILL